MKRLVVACLLTLAAAPVAHAESVLRTMITTDIRGLMPGISPDDNTGLVLQNIYEGLVTWRTDGTVAPMLANSIEVSADGRTYTFALREGGEISQRRAVDREGDRMELGAFPRSEIRLALSRQF